MYVIAVLSCLLLAVSAQEKSAPRKGNRCDQSGLGPVVAQQNEVLISMKSKLSEIEKGQETTKTKLSEIEQGQETTKTKLQTTETALQKTLTNLQNAENQLQETKDELLTLKKERASGPKYAGGSTFVRWGRESCPGNSTLVYAGRVGGKHYNQKGSGTNYLCLTMTPQFDQSLSQLTTFTAGHLYGAEYEISLPSGLHNRDVPCSVCQAPQPSTIMVPGTHTCPQGWAPQYTGHLVSMFHNHYATEYLCLDGNPEYAPDGAKNDDGVLFYYVAYKCGSLPCTTYTSDKVVTCIVCSK